MDKNLMAQILADLADNDSLFKATGLACSNRIKSANKKHSCGKTTVRRNSTKEAIYGNYKSFLSIIILANNHRNFIKRMSGFEGVDVARENYSKEEIDKMVGYLNERFSEFLKVWIYRGRIHMKVRKI